jgi:hypothetical protein
MILKRNLSRVKNSYKRSFKNSKTLSVHSILAHLVHRRTLRRSPFLTSLHGHHHLGGLLHLPIVLVLLIGLGRPPSRPEGRVDDPDDVGQNGGRVEAASPGQGRHAETSAGVVDELGDDPGHVERERE